jgi:hypothetical protein
MRTWLIGLSAAVIAAGLAGAATPALSAAGPTLGTTPKASSSEDGVTKIRWRGRAYGYAYRPAYAYRAYRPAYSYAYRPAYAYRAYRPVYGYAYRPAYAYAPVYAYRPAYAYRPVYGYTGYYRSCPW